jgi:2-polyprenyl-3-methyl-5-hydroxy-6-metoxy-1,4-benzoquinol methylase
MSQTTTGLRSVLSSALVYEATQFLLGTWPLRKAFVNEYLKPYPGARILEIGCGPGNILRFLPYEIDFTGIDLSEGYIRHASKNYGARGRFLAMDVADLKDMGEKFDIIFSFGLLHHLNDERARNVFTAAQAMLKDGGRYVTFDPAFENNQFWFARKIAEWDRGDEVRTPEAYADLARSAFKNVTCDIRRDLWVTPVTGCLLVCS